MFWVHNHIGSELHSFANTLLNVSGDAFPSPMFVLDVHSLGIRCDSAGRIEAAQRLPQEGWARTAVDSIEALPKSYLKA